MSEWPSNVVVLHRDHLDAKFGFDHPDAAVIAHHDCEVGVCAARTAASIRLRYRQRRY
ncbi:hypothetical protein [Nocardia sp. NPDC019255]|uniref:hypothetical protein n=1 Tax=Nocardia sp. NPDC019255 TaxID=3154591 RepID=UPI0033CC078E